MIYRTIKSSFLFLSFKSPFSFQQSALFVRKQNCSLHDLWFCSCMDFFFFVEMSDLKLTFFHYKHHFYQKTEYFSVFSMQPYFLHKLFRFHFLSAMSGKVSTVVVCSRFCGFLDSSSPRPSWQAHCRTMPVGRSSPSIPSLSNSRSVHLPPYSFLVCFNK